MANRDKYHVLDSGFLVSHFVQQDVVDKLKSLELHPDDVWVVTYPKCGTTWTQQIVRLIRNHGVQDEVKINFAVPWLEAITLPHYVEANFTVENLKRPRAFTSHFSYDLFPCGPPHTTPCKYIYVARNPKDVAVLFYFHTKQIYYPDLTWDSFWKMYIDGAVEFGNYFDHLLSWVPHKDDPNVLFLKYEDMKKDLAQAVTQIAAFLDVNLSEEVLSKIAGLASFKEMSKDNTANYSWRKMWGTVGFMRKGVVGDWKNFLTVEQSAQIDTICAERLKKIGLEFEYE